MSSTYTFEDSLTMKDYEIKNNNKILTILDLKILKIKNKAKTKTKSISFNLSNSNLLMITGLELLKNSLLLKIKEKETIVHNVHKTIEKFIGETSDKLFNDLTLYNEIKKHKISIDDYYDLITDDESNDDYDYYDLITDDESDDELKELIVAMDKSTLTDDK